MANLVLRSIVWLAALGWWVYLRKPAAMTWAVPIGVMTIPALLLMAAGAVVFVWTARTLASGAPNTRDAPAVLLVRGPFSVVRNPLYLAAAAIFAGITTLYGLWRPEDIFLVAAVAVLVHLFVVYREEPATRRRLGPVYDAYRTRVPRWIPRGRRVS